jgi:hypothetical protein
MIGRMAAALALLVLGALPGAAAAQEFSAELVTHRDRGDVTQTQKIFVSDGKMRIEVPSTGEVIIANAAAHTGFVLAPKQKTFAQTQRVDRMAHTFIVVDPADACAYWKAHARKGNDWTCTTVGPEAIGGRSTIKIAGESADRHEGFAWIDTKLHFVIKAQGDGGSMELTNIEEGPQQADLFTVPPDYKKVDMQQMLHAAGNGAQ